MTTPRSGDEAPTRETTAQAGPEANLFEDTVRFLAGPDAVQALAADTSTDQDSIRSAVVLAVPVVITGLARWSDDDAGEYWLRSRLAQCLRPTTLDYQTLADDQPLLEAAGNLLQLVFATQEDLIRAEMSARTGVQPTTASRILLLAMATALNHLASLQDRATDPGFARDHLARQRRQLADSGWEVWLARLVPDNGTGDAEPTEPTGPAQGTEITEEDRDEQTGAMSGIGLLGYEPDEDRRDLATDFARETGSLDGVRRDESGGGLGSTMGLRLVAAGLGVVVLLALVALVQTIGGDDGGQVDATADTDTDADPAATGAPAGDAAAPALENEGVVEETDGATDPELIAMGDDGRTLLLTLADPVRRTTATAVAFAEFNEEDGRFCFRFEVRGLASPYEGHIHVGPAGLKGRIALDLGSLEGNTSGCVDVAAPELQAIQDDLAGHYIELHDANGSDAIRGQLGDAVTGTELVSTDEVAADRSGAVIVLEPGALIMRGPVPDRATFDTMFESFADIDLGATAVVNELEIVPGSPRPSGRILVGGDILFDINTAQISDPENTVIQTLAAIVIARPTWTLLIVGHTDATGDETINEPLSLLRAQSVRDALIAAGVDDLVLQVRGAGSSEPVADNSTPEGRAQNRRIEIEIDVS